jgi:hypothetical protein
MLKLDTETLTRVLKLGARIQKLLGRTEATGGARARRTPAQPAGKGTP